MATDPTIPADIGVVLEPEPEPPDPDRGTVTQPRKGERAVRIRHLATKYPELSQSAIAKRVGCSQDNVYNVLRRFRGSYSSEDIAAFQANKADVFEAVQFRTLASISDSDITNASYLQRVTGAAILDDKIRLSRGQPTSIHVHALVDVLDALRRRDQE